MNSEFPLTCVPDKYLSESHLQALFNEFNTSMKAFQPAASIFSSLVNNVRQVYIAALLGVNEELLYQSRSEARRLAQLKNEQERRSPPEYGTGNPGKAAAPIPCDAKTTKRAADVTGAVGGREIKPAPPLEPIQVRVETISWPAKTFTLHIGSFSKDIRRDMADWKPMDRDGWTERLAFKAFQFEEPGTIKIEVIESSQSYHRVIVVRKPWSSDGWKKRLEFYAYDQARPGTQMIWIAYRADPERCIFLKGDQGDRLEGWERKFEFWVPL